VARIGVYGHWLVRNLMNCFIWFSDIWGFVQNSLEEILSIFESLVYLCILEKFMASSVR
jgi:hypothetical protein